LSVVAPIVEISHHKEKLLCRALAEKFQVALENDLQKAVIRGSIPSDIGGPHIYEKHICDCQREQRRCLLKGHPLFTSLLRISALNIEDEGLAVPRLRHPDALGRLLASSLVIHCLELRLEKEVQQGRLSTRLAPNDSDTLVIALLSHHLMLFQEPVKVFAEIDGEKK